MGIYNRFHSHFIQPLSDYVTGCEFHSALKLVNESQWWSKNELYEYQCFKLQKMIGHAYNNVAYYKEKFDLYAINPASIKTPEDLRVIPTISKEEFRRNFPGKILASGYPYKSYFKVSTSGSTGRQLTYYISKNAYGMINAAAVRGWQWTGYQLGDKYIKVTQNTRKSFIKYLQDNVNHGYLHTYKYDLEGIKELIHLITKVRPKILRSYPDPLVFISNYINKNKISLPHIHAITTTGNILFLEERELIERTFNAKIFDSFSCEGSTHADECTTHTCYHLSDEYAITEIIDENGKEVKPGERGTLITTDLWNYACPFIRYETMDYLVKSEKSCECGRELACIDKIDGRDNDILITPDGKYLIAQNFTTYFKHIEAIEQFQIVQDTPDTLKFKFKVNKDYNSKIEKYIITYWKNYTNHLMIITIDIVEEIPVRSSGKRQFLVRNSQINL